MLVILLKKNNCTILYSDLDEETWGCTVSSNRCHTIIINEHLPDFIKDFVILHELGHKVLHPGISTPFFRNIGAGATIPKIEREANIFALEILKRKIDGHENMSKYEIISYLGLPIELERFV